MHWRICAVLEALLTVAEKHDIQVWADYGTLLGLKRDKGVILWDYDADLGMFDADRERLLEAVKIEQAKGTITPLLVMDENYYEDRGCMAAYLATNAEVRKRRCDFSCASSHLSSQKRTQFHNSDICDIIFNVIDGDMIKSLQSPKVLEDYPCAYNYSGKVSDVLPLRPDVLLGHRVCQCSFYGFSSQFCKQSSLLILPTRAGARRSRTWRNGLFRRFTARRCGRSARWQQTTLRRCWASRATRR